MADSIKKTAIVEIQYDTKAAVKSVDNLTSSIEGQKVAQAQLKSQLEKGEISQKQYATEVEKSKTIQSKANAERKNTIQLLSAEKGSANELKANIKKLTAERDKLNTSTKSGKEEASRYNKKIDEMKTALKGAQTETGKTSGAMSKFGKDLTNIPGPIGGIIKGIVGMTKAGLAFIATPLGMVIAAIALAIMAVKKAFQASEEGQNKFAKIMGVINAILGNMGDLLADLGEKIIWVFENPKKALKEFGELIKKNIVNRFNGLLELIPQLGKALNQLFHGEFKEAGKTAANALVKVALGVDDITGKLQNAIDKTKEFMAENMREGALAAKVADMRAKAAKLDRALLIERAKLESQIAELRLKAREEDKYTASERKKFILEARDLQEGLLAREKESLELKRDAQILENTFSRTNIENKDKEAAAIAAVSQKEAERFNQARQLQRELNTVEGQIEAERNKAAAERGKTEADELKRRTEAMQKIAELKQAEIEKEAEDYEIKNELQIERAEEEKELLLEQEGLLNEEKELIEEQHKANLIAIEEEYQNNIRAQRQRNLDELRYSLDQIVSASSEMADKRVSISGDAFAKLASINYKEIKNASDAFTQIASAASGLTSLITAGHEKELSSLEGQKQAELKLVGDNKEAQDRINVEYAKRVDKIKRKQFEDDKKKAIIDASIATALGIVNGLKAGMPIGIVYAALAAVLGGIQIAAIGQQHYTPTPSYAKGGMIGGKPHSQGGTTFIGSDGSKFEAEKGEAMFVLKKDATAEIAALSMLNESHGGRSFTDGKSRHLADGGEVDTIDMTKAVNEEIQRTPVVVSVESIEAGFTNYRNTKEAGVV